MIDEDIVELCLTLKDLLCRASDVAVETLEVVYVSHIDVELRMNLCVNVHWKNVGREETDTVDCEGRREGRE